MTANENNPPPGSQDERALGNNGNVTSSKRLKAAASLLLKGGKLVDDPCKDCGGAQVEFKGKKICINCGREISAAIESQAARMKDSLGEWSRIEFEKTEPNTSTQRDQAGSLNEATTPGRHSAMLFRTQEFLESKIEALAHEIWKESSIESLIEMITIMERLVNILEKIKILTK